MPSRGVSQFLQRSVSAQDIFLNDVCDLAWAHSLTIEALPHFIGNGQFSGQIIRSPHNLLGTRKKAFPRYGCSLLTNYYWMESVGRILYVWFSVGSFPFWLLSFSDFLISDPFWLQCFDWILVVETYLFQSMWQSTQMQWSCVCYYCVLH